MATATHPLEPTEEEKLWRVLKALGNSVRLQIVRFVQQHPRCICNDILLHLPNDVARAQSTLSQHLEILRDAGLIAAKNDGSATCYHVNDEQLAWLHEKLSGLRA